ncbi:MAG: Gfo/Idh/MocA family oxidoreductase [Planctomycetota bacterium]
MSRATQRAAVIGAGMIAKEHLGALAETPGVEVVGVCDLSPVMAESTADRFGVKHWTTDYRQLLDEQRPDVVHVTTPAASHFAIARDCLEAGASVLVEKPITLTLGEFETLNALAESNGLWLLEDHNYRFNTDIAQLLADRDNGELGEVRFVEVRVHLDLFGEGSRFADRDAPHPAMREPLGAVSDFLTHLAYLAHTFIGPHQSVATVAHRLRPECPGAISEFQALIQAGNASGLLALSTEGCTDGFWVRVEGTKKRVEVNLFEVGSVTTADLGGPQPLLPLRNMRRRASDERRNSLRSFSRKLSGGPGAYEGLWSLVKQTYAARTAGGPPPISPQTVREVNQLVHAVSQSGVAT